MATNNITTPATPQPDGFSTLAEIEAYKARLKTEIQGQEHEIASLWSSLFHKQESHMPKTPMQRIMSMANVGTGVLDGLLLGWKLYRKFNGACKRR